jgi:NAD(P)-dependent dehydrogenase (short-subunit alcohol dehydrogenase family)
MTTPNLQGKTCLITGGTSGIGLEAAVDIAAMGAQVVVTGRNRAKAEVAVADIKRRSGSPNIDLLIGDFESQKSTRALAAHVLEKYPAIHILVNNAGTVFPNRELTEDGIEKTFAVNHLGYFLFTELLINRIIASAPARIVNVSSAGHLRATMDFDDLGFERGYSIMKAYGRSKLGNVLFTVELSKRLAGKNVTVNSLHPGGVATNIWSKAPWYARPILAIAQLFMLSPHDGSKTITYLATSPEVEGVTAKYFIDCKPAKTSRLARDEALAARLWDVSARLVKLA